MTEGLNSELARALVDLHVRVIEHMMARQTEHDALVARVLEKLVDDRGTERAEKAVAAREAAQANEGWARPLVPDAGLWEVPLPPQVKATAPQPPTPTHPLAGLREEDASGHGDIIQNFLNDNPTLPNIKPQS